MGLTRAWQMDQTCAATRRRAGLNHHSQYLRHWIPARDNQALGPGDKPFSSLQSLRCTSQDMLSEKYCTCLSLLRTTHESESVGQPGQSTASIESPKVKNLLVTAFVKMSTRAVIAITGMRASLSACAPQMVHLQTAWNSTTRIKEVRRANAVITPGRGV